MTDERQMSHDLNRALAELTAEGAPGHAASVPIAVPAAVGERAATRASSKNTDGGAERTSVTDTDGGHGDDHSDPQRQRSVMSNQIRYAVLERSEREGIESLDHEIFDDWDDAMERARWCSTHLTGSYAEAGDTVVTIVGIEPTGLVIVDGLSNAERESQLTAGRSEQ